MWPRVTQLSIMVCMKVWKKVRGCLGEQSNKRQHAFTPGWGTRGERTRNTAGTWTWHYFLAFLLAAFKLEEINAELRPGNTVGIKVLVHGTYSCMHACMDITRTTAFASGRQRLSVPQTRVNRIHDTNRSKHRQHEKTSTTHERIKRRSAIVAARWLPRQVWNCSCLRTASPSYRIAIIQQQQQQQHVDVGVGAGVSVGVSVWAWVCGAGVGVRVGAYLHVRGQQSVRAKSLEFRTWSVRTTELLWLAMLPKLTRTEVCLLQSV